MDKYKLLIRDILYVVLFAALFFLIQFIFEIGGALIYGLGNNLRLAMSSPTCRVASTANCSPQR